ncbi:hypothetical protein DT075_06015 [Bacillus licheniformis]|nr:hypothetical protein DT075_06015 [Bacillus licheniformis]
MTARAVARLSVLSELCLPLVKKDGLFVALKAASADEEIETGKKAIKTLGGKIETVHSFLNTLCDVGAGAGFPSLPIKICFPHLHVTIVDSLNKRIHFLNQLSAALKLENTAFYHDRAETFGRSK